MSILNRRQMPINSETENVSGGRSDRPRARNGRGNNSRKRRNQAERPRFNSDGSKRPSPVGKALSAEKAVGNNGALQDGSLYAIGPSRGGKPRNPYYAINFEETGLAVLIKQMWHIMIARDGILSRTLPFSAFQHYVSTLNWISKISASTPYFGDSRFLCIGNAVEITGSNNLTIPTPLGEYMSAYCTHQSVTGDKVYYNLPSVAIPQAALPAFGQQPAVDIGSFGRVTASCHNAYECYHSPMVTKAYINATIAANVHGAQVGDWQPFAAGNFPDNCTVNENMLGYYRTEWLHQDANATLLRFNFDNGNSIYGRIGFSAELMAYVSAVLASKEGDFNMQRGFSKASPTPAVFVQNYSTADDLTAIVRTSTTLLHNYSSFSAATGNRSIFHSYRRYRTVEAPGSCYMQQGVDPQLPPEFLEHRNDNLDLIQNDEDGDYSPLIGIASSRFNDRVTEEYLSKDCLPTCVAEWLNRCFLKTSQR